jgi:hypothetical protein
MGPIFIIHIQGKYFIIHLWDKKIYSHTGQIFIIHKPGKCIYIINAMGAVLIIHVRGKNIYGANKISFSKANILSYMGQILISDEYGKIFTTIYHFGTQQISFIHNVNINIS